MCGICGIYHTDHAPKPFGPKSFGPKPFGSDEALVRRMCGQIVHRGPDDIGLHVDGPIGLGMRRLSIIDVEGGSQPIFNEDGSICVVQNGEIYNFQELRDRLESQGHRFSSRCDTEVIVHLYEEYGLSFVDHLNGMFAIALWDSKRQRLVLVRDRLGVKPLYYAQAQTTLGRKLLFGSEIKCILQDESVSGELDHQAVFDYFTLGYIPQPRSVYAAIRKLPPASRLVAERGRVTIDQYWSVPNNLDPSLEKNESIDRLRELLTDAVRLRMISDVPLGAFLSGGLDSSIVVALMARQSARPVKTFFIDFDESPYSEREYARAVARRFGTDHHEFVVRPSAVEILDDLIHSFDEPFGDSSAIPTHYVSHLTRRHVTVALAGDGGDESFGGYNRYKVILNRPGFSAARRLVNPLVQALDKTMPRRIPGKRFLRSLGQQSGEFFVVGTQEIEARRLLTRAFLAEIDKTVMEDLSTPALCRHGGADPLLPYSRFDLQWYLPDDILTKVDRMSMAHSLEVRGPFLDYRVVELAARMPANWKIPGPWGRKQPRHETKHILKEAFGDELPDVVLKPRKHGFSIPLAEWFRGQLRPTLEEVINDRSVEEAGVLNMKEVRGLAGEHFSGARDRSSQLWRILFFARWWNTARHMEKPGPAKGAAIANALVGTRQ